MKGGGGTKEGHENMENWGWLVGERGGESLRLLRSEIPTPKLPQKTGKRLQGRSLTPHCWEWRGGERGWSIQRGVGVEESSGDGNVGVGASLELGMSGLEHPRGIGASSGTGNVGVGASFGARNVGVGASLELGMSGLEHLWN